MLPLFQHLDQLATERWARQGVRTLLRAAWLSVCVWCVGLGGRLLWGWPLNVNVLGAVSLAVIGGAVVLLLRRRLSPRAAARRLDRRFHLDEQLATAVEVAATNPPPGSIGARLLAESGHTAELLRRRIARRQRLPWQDVLTLVALGLVALGLAIMSGIGFPNLAGDPAPLPPLAQAQDPAEQFPREPQGNGDTGLDVPVPGGANGQPGEGAPGQGMDASSQPSPADPQVTRALADALRDQGATRPAAQALDRGDLAGAARDLRTLADQSSQLSQETRDELARRLNDAAAQIEGRNQDLADQLQQSADGLTRGGQRAAEALDDLARAIERLGGGQQEQQGQQGQQGQGQAQDQGQGQQGQQGQGQDQGQGQNQGQGQGNASGAGNGSAGEQRQSSSSQRLGVEGQPVPLDAAGAGELPVPSSGQNQPTAGGASRPGFTQGGSSSGQRVQTGADPLRVPLDERDVVQEYFQPK